MRTSFRAGAAALGAAVGLLTGASHVAAQAPAQPSIQAAPAPEQIQLGVQFSEQMLSVLDLNALVSKQMTSSLAGANGEMFQVEPKWRDFMVEALQDEFKSDHGAIAAVLGRTFARSFTADELKVGLVLFRDPAMVTVMKAFQGGQQPPAGLNPQPATLQALGTPAGRTFQTKFSNIGPIMDGAKNDFVRVLMPGVFQRFAEKAVALERQRRQAEGLPAYGG